jgi:ferredoxin
VTRQDHPEPAPREGEGSTPSPETERLVHALRVCIDRSLCVGFGDCVTASPEAFALDEENVVVFVTPEGVTPERLLDACRACPVDALTVWDADGRQIAP